MIRSLFILMLVGAMVGVGFYFDRHALTGEDVDTNLMAGTAVTEMPTADSSSGGLVSGVHLDALDRDTRPQDDFYQFTNGGWLDSTEIPEIYSGYTVYHQVNEEAEVALRKIIEGAAAEPGEKGTESQQVGDIYNAWMDEETINAKGIDPVRGELEQIDAVDSVAELVNVMAQLNRKGVSGPFGMYVYADLKNSSHYTVYAGQSGLTMPDRDYYLKLDNENFAKAREALPGYIAAMLERADYSPEDAKTAAQGIYDLEAAIAKAHWDTVTNRDPEKIYNPHTLDELAKSTENLDWGVFLGVMEFDGTDKLVVQQPSYFEALDGMLVEIPLSTWKDYMKFRILDGAGGQLDQTTADIRFDYRNRTLNGQQQPRPRWKRGISMVNGMVGEAVGKLYVAEYFPPEAKEKMEELVGNVIATLDDDIDELEWMSEATRAKAKVKLSKFTPKIGYPDVWKDYSQLDIQAGDHVGNLRRTTEWAHQIEIERVGQPVDKTEWHMTPQTVNAYYSPTQNEIVFPAARLQPPFFQLNADDAINYGAVGGVIGHEISHGFDDKGSKFDGDGNLSNWWTDDDRAAFEARAAVLVEQFNGFEPIEGMHINGEQTLGENIGDLSGIAMAYRAYIRSLDGKEAPVIDGFTGPQRFFIGYAMSRKGKYKEESTINRLASGVHSPLKYRVNGPYPNIDAFHEAWETKEGDGMWLAPEDRVKIW